MAFPLAIPLVSLVGGLLSSVVGSVISKEMSESTMKTQAEINQQGIDTANRYNHPINVMGRLREAGLNPNLVYGNGSVPGITQDGSASTNQGLKTVPFNLGISDAVDKFLQTKQIDQSVKESKARELELLNRAEESRIRQEQMGLEFSFNKETYDSRVHQTKRLSTMLEKRLDYLSSEIYRNEAAADELWSRGQLNREKLHEVHANVALLEQRTGLTKEQIVTEGVKRSMYYSNMLLNGAVIEKISHEIAYLDAGTSLRELAYKIQNVNFEGTRMGDEWLSEHPTIATIENLVRRVLEDVGKVFGGSVSYKVD